MVAPDLEENHRRLPALAEAWGVELVLGDEFNVVRRLLATAEAHQADRLARVVMPSFYVDPALVAQQLGLLAQTQADYCLLPRDFSVNFGADVVAVNALRRFDALVATWDDTCRDFARYRPWPFLERMGGNFSLVECADVPSVTSERIDWIRAHPNWPERAGPGVEGGEHRALACDYLTGAEVVLDAGCGHGEISNILSGYAAHVSGVDYDADMVEIARSRFPHCDFEAADLQRWSRPKTYDVIFHCHTLEHCPDPVAVLTNLGASLRDDGRLIVEVPLEIRPGVINPHHEREYTVDRLRAEVASAGLQIDHERGVTRGVYGAPADAREAYLVVCCRDTAA